MVLDIQVEDENHHCGWSRLLHQDYIHQFKRIQLPLPYDPTLKATILDLVSKVRISTDVEVKTLIPLRM